MDYATYDELVDALQDAETLITELVEDLCPEGDTASDNVLTKISDILNRVPSAP